MKPNKNVENKAFTLIEAVTSIFIIALISGIIFSNFRQSSQQLSLQRSANILSQDLRRVQQMAMSVRDYTCIVGKLKGFGIYFFKGADAYSLYARCDIGGVFNDIDIEYHDELKKNGVIIGDLIPNPDPLKIFFYPPDPIVDIGGATDATIILSPRNASMTKTVKINGIGLIKIQ